MTFLADVSMSAISGLATLFVFGVGTVLLMLVVMFVLDMTQTSDSDSGKTPAYGSSSRIG